MWLPWLLSTVGMVFFGWQMLVTMRELNEVERERDALWNELHLGIKREAGK